MPKKTDVKNIYALSPMQEGMLFHALMDERSTAYVEQTVMTLSGTLEPGLFETAIQGVVNRYDILRTVFVYKNTKRPRQVVLNRQTADFHFTDLTRLEPAAAGERLAAFHREDRQKGFDLTRGPLLRVNLFKTGDRAWQLVWTFHHILMDGWCLRILFQDFMRLYYAAYHNISQTLEPAAPYSRYIRWLENRDKQKGLAYWTAYLENCGPPSALPKLRIKPAGHAYQGGDYLLALDEPLTQQLRQVAAECKVTENTLFQTLWGILLQRYNDARDAVFGAVVSGRPAEIPGAADMVGLFINTVPVRIQTEPGETFEELLKKHQLHSLQARAYEYLPLAEIQAGSSLENQPLDHIAVFENYPVGGVTEIAQKASTGTGHDSSGKEPLTIGVLNMEMVEQTNYDLNVVVGPGPRMTIKFIFNSRVYDRQTIEQTAEQLNEMFRQVLNNPGIPVDHIEILSPREKKRILVDLNDTATGFPRDKTIPQLFEEQVEKRPDAAAVVGSSLEQGYMTITYRELDNQANHLAHLLRKKGVQADNIAAIMIERSIEMITGIMGILKTGGAYLPIDPGYPQERIDYMLKDSSASHLLTNEGVTLSRQAVPGMIPLPGGEPEGRGGSLAYVIYTSGTTGNPKGVLISHRSVARLVKKTDYLEMFHEDRFLTLSNYAFDASIFDIFGTLLNGAALVLMEGEGISSLDRLPLQLKREGITVFFLTTALFNALVDMDIQGLKNIRKVLYGGERISIPHARKALDYMGPGRIIHVYGPTETTVYATYYPIDNIDDTRATIPIGKPIANTTAYILNKEMKPLPMGAAGELYLGGEGTARGYLNRPGLTASRFIYRSYKSYRSYKTNNKKIYKTGDLVRMLPDGNIEFLGRVDRQVKVRGFRVEPGEIEDRLLKHSSVKEALVIASGGETTYLCAYIICTGDAAGQPPDTKLFKEYLAQTLPVYMVPAYFMILDRMPLNPSGKTDFKALPRPAAGSGAGHIAMPQTPFETQIAAVWAEVLHIAETIDVDSDFFDLGGHSLRAMTMVSRLHKETGIKISLKEVFAHPTIRQLAALMEKASSGEGPQVSYRAVEPAEQREYYPLSSAQKRLYIFQQKVSHSTGYNILSVLEVEGAIDKNRFKEVFLQLIQRHESLRTCFRSLKGEPVQVVQPPGAVVFDVEETSAAVDDPIDDRPASDIVNDFVRSFDLAHAPLMRVGLARIKEHTRLLMVDMNHIISDGASMGLLTMEFLALYQGAALPPLRLQFKDYAIWHHQTFGPGGAGEAYRRQEAYWLKHLQGKPPALNLPMDYPRPDVQDFAGHHLEFQLDEQVTRSLKELASRGEATLFMVLLAVCGIWLAKLTGQDDIVVGTPIEGRAHPDLRGIIGMFVNTLVLRTFPGPRKTFEQYLNEVKSGTLAAYENQDYLFEDLVKALDYSPEPGRSPLFDVLFTLQNMEASPGRIPGPAPACQAADDHLQMKPFPFKNPVSKFDMMITAAETAGNQVHITVEYAVRLFKEETIQRFIDYFNDVVGGVVTNNDIPLGDIEVSHGLTRVKSHNPGMDLGF
jgi:amino acid adenylation domain-containing protein